MHACMAVLFVRVPIHPVCAFQACSVPAASTDSTCILRLYLSYVSYTNTLHLYMQRCRDMIEQAKARGVQLLLPSDVLISHSLSAAEETRVVPLTLTCCSVEQPCIPSDAYGLDIGPVTTEAFAKAIIRCKTIFWNGPMGKFEVAGFDKVR